MSGDGELWSFTFRVLPGTTPGAVRVRRLLKYALRSLGLRCVRLSEPDEVAQGKRSGAEAARPSTTPEETP